MPLETQEFDLVETLEAKRDEREEIADEAAAIDPDNPAFGDLARQGNQLDTHISGLEWAVDNWDVDAITLVGMTGGETARMENELAKDGNGIGDARIATVVHGTQEAPYIDEDGDEAATYYAVGQLPFAVQKWVEDEVNDMTEVGNGGTTFGALVEEKRHQAAGTDS